jgi:glutamate 5-kinase
LSNLLISARRIVIKIGSSTLVSSETGHVHQAWLDVFAQEIANIKARGQEVILVSSGAIALGRRLVKLGSGQLRLEQSQAAAAIGQIAMMRCWSEGLGRVSHLAAQLLLTLDDTEDRRRYLNARATLSELLALGVIPVINENDSVATTEIRYGDNDRLAARVAGMIEADLTILLSDIDGLYTSDPRKDPNAKIIDVVRAITPEIEAMAGGAGTSVGSGGMNTKIIAAKQATEAGCHLVIARGDVMGPLTRLEQGATATWFVASASPQAARKRWIAGTLNSQGALVIDDGAVAALKSGKSLLPAGVRSISGAFARGDCVLVNDLNGKETGRGLVAYDADDARAILGRKSGEIEALLGFRGRDEIIHRDDFVLKVQ